MFLTAPLYYLPPPERSTPAPFKTAPTLSTKRMCKNPILDFPTLIWSLGERCSLFLLNIYTWSIFLRQENAHLCGAPNCFHPTSQMQMNSREEGQTYLNFPEPFYNKNGLMLV